MSHIPDAWRIVSARALRSFAYGLLAVALGVWLARIGLSTIAIGAIITVSLAGDFCGTYLIGIAADTWGRRRTLVALALLMAATGAIFALSRFLPLLLGAAFFGTLGASASESAPFLPIEQSMLPQTVPSARRTTLFVRYNLAATVAGALGALAAGAPDLLAQSEAARTTGIRALFGVYVVAALGVAALAASLSPAVEPHRPNDASSAEATPPSKTRRQLVPPLGRSRGMVLRLSALFSLDAFAGGFVVQSLMTLFFHLRFGVSLGALAALFFAVNIVTALSFLAVGPIARRIGLLNTMVFTHLPSNLLLILVAFMPTYPLAAGMLLLRQSLSQMDVPTRQAYTMALVAPAERTAAASVTSLARSAGASLSPVLAGLMLQPALLALGLPFIVAGMLKVGQDLGLWIVFRHVRLPPEPPRHAAERAASESSEDQGDSVIIDS